MKWIGQHIYDLVSRFRNDVIIEDSDGSSITMKAGSTNAALGYSYPLQIFQPVNDASPTINLGSSNTEKLSIRAFYQSGTQEMQVASFSTSTAESDADRGKFQFTVDGTNIVAFLDDGIDLFTGKGISINGTDILTDSSGTATLSNIDDYGTIGTGVWNGSVIASAYLDADTAHLSGIQTFTGKKIFNDITSAIFDGDKSVTPGDGAVIHVDAHDVTDTATSASGTAAMYTHVNIEAPRLEATNSSVTTTTAATLRINNAPAVGTNQTITNPYALWVDDGAVLFDGSLRVVGTITGDLTGDVTGDLTGQADTVATIAGLAPNTATTQATQGNITTLAGVTSIGATTMAITSGVVNHFRATNDGNPVYSMGSSGTNELKIQTVYHSGAQTLEQVIFRSETASGTADDGKMIFQVDGLATLQIDDGGIDFVANHGISIDGTDILTDSSGTATLSNIDALDATTAATIQAASTHKQIVNLKGYATLEDGNYLFAQDFVDNKAPWLLSQDYTSGTINSSTELQQRFFFLAGGFHVPIACTLDSIQVQATVNGSGDGDVTVAVVEYRPSDHADNRQDYPRTVYEEVVVGSNNHADKVETVNVALAAIATPAIAAGSHLLIMVKGDGDTDGDTAVVSVSMVIDF